MPDVLILPNHYRPGAGRVPHSERSRPLLPAHARHCPALEAGSGAGLLVYPSLEPGESYQIRYGVDGSYLLSFFRDDHRGAPGHVFSLRFAMPAGGTGIWAEEIVHWNPHLGVEEAGIFALRDAILRTGSLGVPPGAVGLRGAQDFRTPPGWDAIFTPVLNLPQRPLVAGLTARVETDWYANETEFRYLLQPGDMLSALGTMPIGQVIFVPREPVTLHEADAAEIAAFHDEQTRFNARKAASRVLSSFGLAYDSAYRQESNRQRGNPDGSTAATDPDPA
jgi:hypothetical protein